MVATVTIGLHLRRAVADDARMLWHWVNDPEVRRASFSSETIAWDEHVAWFEAKLRDRSCAIYIACDAAGTPVGQVRLDASDSTAVISVSLAADARGRGLAAILIRQACEAYFASSETNRIDALIRRDNERSQRAFAAAGFQHDGDLFVKGQPAVRLVLQKGSS